MLGLLFTAAAFVGPAARAPTRSGEITMRKPGQIGPDNLQGKFITGSYLNGLHEWRVVSIVHALSLTNPTVPNHRRLHAHPGVPPVAAFSHITMQQGRAAAFASATLAAARFSELSTIVCMYTNSAFSIVPDESVSTMSNSTSAV